MKVFAAAALLIASAAAQVTINPDGTITCPASSSNQAFCAGDSLQTNFIIRCVGSVGQPGNCNDNLAGIPPVGVKIFAPCFQTSPTAGDAACSFDGTAYPDNGPPFLINGTSSALSSVPTPIGTGVPAGTGVIGTGTVSPTGGAGSGSGGSPGGYNATGSGGIPSPTATPTIAIGAASLNGLASLAVVLAVGVFAIAL